MAKTYLTRFHGVKELDHGDITIYEMTLVDEDNMSLALTDVVTLDGYEVGDADELAPEDTLLEAFAKLEGRMVALESRVDDLENPPEP